MLQDKSDQRGRTDKIDGQHCALTTIIDKTHSVVSFYFMYFHQCMIRNPLGDEKRKKKQIRMIFMCEYASMLLLINCS